MKRCLAGLTALVLILAALPGAALARSAPALSWQERGGGILLTLTGVEESLYAIQAELVLKGSFPDAAFSPALADAYSPECRVDVRRGETTVTLYLVSEGDGFSTGSLLLGSLRPGGADDSDAHTSALPSRAALTLLDRDLKALESGGNVSLSKGSGSVSGGHAVKIGKCEHGKVTASPASAFAGETVTLTVTPDAGYALDRLTVTDSRSRSVQVRESGGKRTFLMPDYDVEVNASFVPSDGSGGSGSSGTPGITITTPLPFTDIAADAWCYDAVRYVYQNGLMNGTTATTFTPNSPTTRGMIVAILYRLEGSPAAGTSRFTDVASGAYYAPAVAWASANGIVNGYADNTFRPGNPITREQMAAFLFRYAAYKGMDVSARADLSGYTDAGLIASYAVDPIRWANARGLINGTTPTTLAPRGHTTRAQAAVILSRYAQTVAGR